MRVTGYSVPGSDDGKSIGIRARQLRELLGMTFGQLAAQAKVTERDVEALENGEDVSLTSALAIHHVLSGEGAGDALFTSPRLRSIDEVEAFEKRRLGSQ